MRLPAAVLLLLLAIPPLHAQLPPPSPGTIAAGVVPGDWMRATLTHQSNDSARQGRDSTAEGALLTLDSSAVALRVADGTVRRISRPSLARLQVRQGRSRWMPALFGYLGALPVSLVLCSGERYECDKGMIPPLVGGIIGYAVGRDRWQDVRLP